MLTGTPLQNDLGELQNLLQFILPDVFDQQNLDLTSHLQVRPLHIIGFGKTALWLQDAEQDPCDDASRAESASSLLHINQSSRTSNSG